MLSPELCSASATCDASLGLNVFVYLATSASSSAFVALAPVSTIVCDSVSLRALNASPWSLFATSMPSSPYMNCIMCPCGSLTVPSYSSLMCSSAFMRRRCM